MRQKELQFNNAVNGLKRDSVSPEDLLNSLHTFDNLKLKYEGGLARMIVRNGYERWNTEALPAPAKQIYHFVDQSRTEWLLGVCGTYWYWILQSLSPHVKLNTDVATVPQANTAIRRLPIITVGNRAMFGTDSGWYWTDGGSMTGATHSFQVGIDPPSDPPSVAMGAPDGVIASATHHCVLNTASKYKMAFPITPTYKTLLKNVAVMVKRFGFNYAGSWRAAIYTNNAGNPSTSLVSTDAVSIWREVVKFNLHPLAYGYKNFTFLNPVTLNASTTYWIVIESDDAYKDNYHVTNFYASVGGRSAGSLTYTYPNKVWDTTLTPDAWDPLYISGASPPYQEAVFQLGSTFSAEQIVDYVYTYYNSTYGIESRKSGNTRVAFDSTHTIGRVGVISASDLQVDKFRVYRRDLDTGLDWDAEDDAITAKYYYLGDSDIAVDFIDTTDIGVEGNILQTDDHYRIGEADDNDPHVRTSVLPRIACFWKGRVFVAEGSKLYFSKRLEEDGASGLAGDPIPDYFPPENTIDTYMTSDIIGLKQMGDDQLVMYFANSAIWVIMGFDSTLNPPDPAEYRFVQVVTSGGLIASSALVDIEGGHALLTRRGLRAFAGTTDMPYLSENVKSILDGITDEAIDNSLLLNFGNELWLGIDSDADGYADEFYILDMLSSKPYWRRYDYGLRFGDVIVRESGKYATGSSYKSILASDMDSNYILELEKGTEDNLQAIDWEWRTHRLRVGRYSTALMLEFSGFYPGTPPAFTVNVRDHVDNVKSFSRTPNSSTDVRNHRMGVRFNSPQSLQVGMSGSSLYADEIWGFKLSYNTES